MDLKKFYFNLPFVKWMYQTWGNISNNTIRIHVKYTSNNSKTTKTRYFSNAMSRGDNISWWYYGTTANMLENTDKAPLEADLIGKLILNGVLSISDTSSASFREKPTNRSSGTS